MTFYHIILTAKALAWVGIVCFGVGIFGGGWWVRSRSPVYVAYGLRCPVPVRMVLVQDDSSVVSDRRVLR